MEVVCFAFQWRVATLREQHPKTDNLRESCAISRRSRDRTCSSAVAITLASLAVEFPLCFGELVDGIVDSCDRRLSRSHGIVFYSDQFREGVDCPWQVSSRCRAQKPCGLGKRFLPTGKEPCSSLAVFLDGLFVDGPLSPCRSKKRGGAPAKRIQELLMPGCFRGPTGTFHFDELVFDGR